MPHIVLFIAAAFVLAVTPGPGMFYVVGRTWAAGRGDGFASSLGTMLGGFVHVLACVVGVSALVMASATAFSEESGRSGFARAFRQGVVVEATNPKTAAFFLAFIPQFIVIANGHVALQFLVLGVISVMLNTGADLVAVMGAARLHEKLVHRPGLFRRLRQGSGLLMASLGVGLLAARRG
jgi:threonine/homoserine/homoserine lactone efflux protein